MIGKTGEWLNELLLSISELLHIPKILPVLILLFFVAIWEYYEWKKDPEGALYFKISFFISLVILIICVVLFVLELIGLLAI